MLADVFVNNDCDACIYLSYQVSALSRIAQGSQIADTNFIASSQTVSVKKARLSRLL
jgi:guanine nucleotide-exchange factor